MELEVMTKGQAEKRPAGFGRNNPNTNPTIDEPMLETSSLTHTSFDNK